MFASYEKESAAENCLLKSILVDSDILIEVSRARDDVILARWKDLSQSVNPLL